MDEEWNEGEDDFDLDPDDEEEEFCFNASSPAGVVFGHIALELSAAAVIPWQHYLLRMTPWHAGISGTTACLGISFRYRRFSYPRHRADLVFGSGKKPPC